MGMKEIKAESYRLKKLRLLNLQWRQADLKVAQLEENIRQLKRTDDLGTPQDIADRKSLLLKLKQKRLSINVELSRLNPMFDVGEEIH